MVSFLNEYTWNERKYENFQRKERMDQINQ